MTATDILSLILPVVFFCGAGIVGYQLGRRGLILLASLLVVILTVAGIVIIVRSGQATGWDRLGLYVIGVGYFLPAAFCSGIGAIWGWRRRRVK